MERKDIIAEANRLFPPDMQFDADRPEHLFDNNFDARRTYIDQQTRIHLHIPKLYPREMLEKDAQKFFNALVDIDQLLSYPAHCAVDLIGKPVEEQNKELLERARVIAFKATQGEQQERFESGYVAFAQEPCVHPQEAIRSGGLGKPSWCGECGKEI